MSPLAQQTSKDLPESRVFATEEICEDVLSSKDKGNFREPPVTTCKNSDISQEDLVINDISSTDPSTHSMSSGEPADMENSDEGSLKFFRSTLQDAGYTASEVDDAI